MDLYFLISLVSVMYSWTLCTVLSAPAGETPGDSLVRHVRNKRCSCASFQDKECVYFCHLDIIWVNTPERVVSYGLGNAPRRRRALPAPSDSMVTGGGPRCKCAKENDNTCANFCRLENRPRNGTPPDTMRRSPKGDGCSGTHCEHKLSTGTGKTNRMNNSDKKQVSPLAIRAALKTRLLLEKWRLRQQHHRAG